MANTDDRELAELAAKANEEAARGDAAVKHSMKHYRAAGEALLAAKARVGHGKWLKWLAENFHYSQVTANKYMQLADNPDKVKPGSNLTQAMRELAEERAADQSIRLAETDDEPADEEEDDTGARYRDDEPPVPSHANADVGRLLALLAQRYSTITIYTPDEAEDGEADTSLTVSPRARGERPRTYCRDGLLECLRAAAAEEASRQCPKCRAFRREADFPRDRGRPGGRFSWCRKCNRENVSQHKEEAKAAAEARRHA